MSHVARDPRSYNVVACQIKNSIYFYTSQTIEADTELVVWYCKQYEDRLFQERATSALVKEAVARTLNRASTTVTGLDLRRGMSEFIVQLSH